MSRERPPTEEPRLRAAVESAPSGLLMVDTEGRIVLVNREIERLFGYPREEILGRSVDLLVPEALREGHRRFREDFLDKPQIRAMGAGRDLYGRRKDGSELPVEIGLNPIDTEEGIFVLASVVDISQRKNEERERQDLEQQLRHAQKLEAVGTLAGGIAHDFNNILGGILGFAELLSDAIQDDRARSDLEELIAFSLRGKKLVQRIQVLASRTEGERMPLSLEGPLGEVESLIRSSFPPNIRTSSRVHEQSGRVLADPTALHQVLMNVAMNAAQAMPGGGRLDMEVDPVYITDSRARAHPHLREGAHELISFSDTGTGIDPDIQDRILEPFFTTKAPGQGSGLGLAIVHRVVREHGGAMEIESTPGAGTTVRIILPSMERGRVVENAAERDDAPRGRGERILYVDDEPGLATVGKRRLEALGYQVALVNSGEEALLTVREASSAFDAVVSDYLMPGMNGLELAGALNDLQPALPVVILTGYIDDLAEEEILTTGVAGLLRKPATTMELARMVASVLRSGAAG